jgi:hypothetical protein
MAGLICLCLLFGFSSPAGSMPALVRGTLGIHDPSTVISCQGRYYVFGTGQNIISRSSSDKQFWVAGPAVFSSLPSWTTNSVTNFTGDFWAPEIIALNGQYCLYYAVSSFGSQVSGIGLATNPTLDPSDPSYAWTDQGAVIQSTKGSAYNTIDPSVTFDAAGNLWMSFGSFWSGIYLVQLNPATGKRISPSSPTYHLAYHNDSADSIEASYLFRRGSYYYLFVNWGSCCAGIASTYNIRVGRSTSITGPYLDQNGVNMVNGGGTLFLEGTGKYIGPGQTGILSEGGTNWLSYHYYDANNNGAPTLDLEPLSWTSDNWPFFTNDWSAVYNFRDDARDDHGQYYGLLRGGANVTNDAILGRVLNLSQTNQYVSLPPGVANGRTFAAEVKWNGGAAWQRIFDFGADTTNYAFLTPMASSGKLHFAITTNGQSGEQIIEGPSALATGVWTHLAVTLDGSNGILYLNGAAVATNKSMSLLPWELMANNNALGKSKFGTDPYFSGQIRSFRVFGRALSPSEIAAPHAVIARPADGSGFWPGQTIAFNGSVTDFSESPLPAGDLSWIVQYCNGGVTNTVLGPLMGVAEGTFTIPSSGPAASNGFYSIQLTATDALARKSVNSVTLFPGATPGLVSNWTAFYPFQSDASDAGGLFDGTLNGGASIQTEAQRGAVLSLSGASQYVSLPAAVGAAQTFSGWVNWNGGAAYQRVFDLGADTSHYLYFTPKASNNRPRLAICADSGGEVGVGGPGAFPVGAWTHVAAVFDGREAVLYLNGSAVAVNNSVNLLPSDTGANLNYLGKSQFSDPYFAGELDSVRLNSSALAPEQFLAPQPVITQPLPGTLYSGGTNLAFAGSAANYADASLASGALQWSVEFHHDGINDLVSGPLTGIPGGSYSVPTTSPATTNCFYRIILTATDTNGLGACASVDLPPVLSRLAFATVPPGLELALDGEPFFAPTSVVAVAGMARSLSAPSPQVVGGTNYSFVLWSDGGAPAHSLVVPETDASFTASFIAPVLEVSHGSPNLFLTWPGWAASLKLYSAANLVPPVQWTIVTNAAALSNGSQTLTLPMDGENRFFRLQSQ